MQRQIDQLLDQAEEAVGNFDWQSAKDSAQAVLDLDPDNQDAVTFLAGAKQLSVVHQTLMPKRQDEG